MSDSVEYYVVYYINHRRIASRNFITRTEAEAYKNQIKKQTLKDELTTEPEIYEIRYR